MNIYDKPILCFTLFQVSQWVFVSLYDHVIFLTGSFNIIATRINLIGSFLSFSFHYLWFNNMCDDISHVGAFCDKELAALPESMTRTH